MQKPGAAVNTTGNGGIVNKAAIFRPLSQDRICGEGSCTITRRGGEGEVLARETGEGNYRRPYYESSVQSAPNTSTTGDVRNSISSKDQKDYTCDELKTTITSIDGISERAVRGMISVGGEGEGTSKSGDQLPTA